MNIDEQPQAPCDSDHDAEETRIRRAVEQIAAGVTRLSHEAIPVRVNVNDADVDKVVRAILQLRRSGNPQSSALLDTLGHAPR